MAPRVRFFRGCVPVLREELEGLRWDGPKPGRDPSEHRPGKAPRPRPGDPDHGVDALRYIVLMRREMGFR